MIHLKKNYLLIAVLLASNTIIPSQAESPRELGERIIDILAPRSPKDDIPGDDYVTRKAVFQKILNQRYSDIQQLIERGADINAQNSLGDTALHIAVYNNTMMAPPDVIIQNSNNDIISFLIDAGANIELKNKAGMTPLDVAKYAGDNACITILQNKLLDELRKTAPIQNDTRSTETILNIISNNYNKIDERELLRKIEEFRTNDPVFKDKIIGAKVLFIAANYGLNLIIEWLMEEGIKTDSGIIDKACMLATNKGHNSTTKLMQRLHAFFTRPRTNPIDTHEQILAKRKLYLKEVNKLLSKYNDALRIHFSIQNPTLTLEEINDQIANIPLTYNEPPLDELEKQFQTLASSYGLSNTLPTNPHESSADTISSSKPTKRKQQPEKETVKKTSTKGKRRKKNDDDDWRP